MPNRIKALLLLAATTSACTLGMNRGQPQDEVRASAQPVVVKGNDTEEGRARAKRAAEACRNKLFLTAFHLAPDQYPSLKDLDTPSITAGTAWRSKSGTKGTSRLEQWSTITSASASRGEDVFRFGVEVLSLASGTPRDDEAIGSSEERRFRPTTRLDAGVAPSIGWSREGTLSPFVELGTTPLNGILSPTVRGRAGTKMRSGDDMELSTEAFREPVLESILSYTGIIDPTTGRGFGRVVETGGQASASYSITERWDAAGMASSGIRTGTDVADNMHTSAELSLSYDLKLPKCDSFTIGPEYSFEHFDRNQSGFTLGNGGYYSPHIFHRIGVGLNFLSLEARDLVVRGSISPGWQHSREEGVPVFPSDQRSGRTLTSRKDSADFDSQIDALYRLTGHWALGAHAHVERSPQFNESFAGISLRFSFGQRSSLVSTDIPVFPIH
jgi:hypothetical protein